MSAHGAPVRNRQKIPFNTRRSSTRGTPRGLFGNNGWITDHSKSDRSKRAISSSRPTESESARHRFGNPRLWVCVLVRPTERRKPAEAQGAAGQVRSAGRKVEVGFGAPGIGRGARSGHHEPAGEA